MAPLNVALAKRVHEARKAWIAPERTAEIEDYLKRIERIVRAGLLADAIAQMGPKEAWLTKVRPVAKHETDRDAQFVALLTQAVEARLDEAVRAEADGKRAERNALLRAVLEGGATRLERLLADRPHLGPLWHRADAKTQDGLLELMRLNRQGRGEPLWRREARTMFALAIGYALSDHPRFHAQNLADKSWNILPAHQRIVLIALQDKRGDQEMRDKAQDNLRIVRRLAGGRTASPRLRRLPLFMERM